MNIAQLKDGGYRIFSRQLNENKEKNIETVRYIETIASQAGVNIYCWNLVEIFGDKEKKRGTHLIWDKASINKLFFERVEAMKADIGIEILDIEKKVSAALNLATSERKERRLRSLKDDRAYHIREANTYMLRADEKLKYAYAKSTEICDIENQSNNIGIQLVNILRDGFWKFISFDGKFLLFHTVGDIINTEINPSAGLNLRVNFGKLKASLNVIEMKLSVHPYENNIYKDNYIHPHISNENNVCWGNAKTQALEHLAKGEIDKAMSLLATLLQSYSAENPYRALVDFDYVVKEMEKTKKEKPAAIIDELEDFDDIFESLPEQIQIVPPYLINDTTINNSVDIGFTAEQLNSIVIGDTGDLTSAQRY